MKLQYVKDLPQLKEAFASGVELGIMSYRVHNPNLVVKMSWDSLEDLPRYARPGWHTALFLPATSPNLAMRILDLPEMGWQPMDGVILFPASENLGYFVLELPQELYQVVEVLHSFLGAELVVRQQVKGQRQEALARDVGEWIRLFQTHQTHPLWGTDI